MITILVSKGFTGQLAPSTDLAGEGTADKELTSQFHNTDLSEPPLGISYDEFSRHSMH